LIAVQYAFTTILMAHRFGWQAAPERLSRLQLYSRIHKMGFEGIEWSPRWLDYDKMRKSEIISLKQEVLDHGLTVCALNLNRFILTHCPQAKRHYQRLIRSIDVARDLGAESVIVSLSLPKSPSADRAQLIGHTISGKEFDQTVKLLSEAACRADSLGVRLVLELHDDGLLDTPALCLRMRTAVDRSKVWINPDLGNLIRNQESEDSWQETLEQLAPYTGYWHIKNYRDAQPTPIWDGDIDYNSAFEIMERHGYAGWVSIESYFGDDVLSLQKQSLDWLLQRKSTTVA